jgi:hypothetical protein
MASCLLRQQTIIIGWTEPVLAEAAHILRRHGCDTAPLLALIERYRQWNCELRNAGMGDLEGVRLAGPDHLAQTVDCLTRKDS